MKHLKKLSVVLMLTTLFSVTFTSCIDNEVSPVVEAIYEAQADLIAAQANVQNAEATKLEAEAAYQLALAAGANADAAYTLEQVEELRIENAAAQLVVDEAQAQFNIDLAFLVAELEEAGAQIALNYALEYRMYANAATDLLDLKATAVYNLAYAQAQMDGSYPGFALASLEVAVNNAKFQVEMQQEKIAALQALIDDPTSLPNQKEAWLQQQGELAASVSAKTIEVNAKQNEADLLLAGANGEQSVRNAFVTLFETYENQADTTWVGTKNWAYQIDVLQDQYDAAVKSAATYVADTTAAGTALRAADLAYSNAWTALGDTEDSDANTISFDGTYQYYQTDAEGVTIGADGAKYAAPANLQEVYVNTRIDLADAQAALATYQEDFDALTGSYNTAANELAAAQAAFDNNTYAADVLAAEGALTTYEAGAFQDAQELYNTTFAAFTAFPNKTVYTDTNVDTFDLGRVGIHTDDSTLGSPFGVNTGTETTKTYYQVATYSTPLATFWVPATTTGAAMDAAGLAARKAALQAANTTGTLTFFDDISAPLSDAEKTAATGDITTDTMDVYFIEVESDDTHNDPILNNGKSGNLDSFNNATNALGTEITTVFYTGTATRDYTPAAYTGIVYPIAPATNGILYDADGYIDTPVTAYQLLWNLQKAVSETNYLESIGGADLALKQTAFEYQQELFDNGLANLALLTGDVTVATTANTAAKKAVDQAWLVLGKELTYTSGDAKLTTGSTDAWYDANFGVSPVSKALTLNAKLFNAVRAVDVIPTPCDADCLAAIQHEIDLLQPSLDLVLSYIADMQAQYDTYMETYVGPGTTYADLDADLKVAYDTLMNEKFQLQQELTNLTAEKAYVDSMVTALASSSTLSQISLQIELAMLWDNAQGGYADSLTDLETAEKALAVAQANIDKGPAYIAYLQAKIDVLDTRYENASALAAKYKALMEAALAS